MQSWLAIAEAMRLYSRMQRIIGPFTYEDQDFKSVFAHAKRLEGKTLREIAAAMKRPDLLERKGKGAAGQMLHAWFGVDENDNRSEPDLPGVEIKVVPLKSARNGLRVKERCKVTSIEYKALLDEEWPRSRARHKLLVTLFIYYRYTTATTWPASTVDRIVMWQMAGSPVRYTIEEDWQRTWHYVRDGRAHELSEGQAAVLGACTSGAGKDSKWVLQPQNPSTKARKRSFALKPSFLQTTYGADKDPDAYAHLPTAGVRDVDRDPRERILTAFLPYVGRTLGDIADSLGIPQVACAGTARPKHAASLLVRRVLGVMSDDKKLFELEALGVKPKTIPARVPDMRPFEAMSFPAMSLAEFAEETWEDSDLRAHLENILMIPLFRKHRDDDYRSGVLGRPFFWTPTAVEEEGIEREWTMFQSEVREGKAAYRRVNNRRVSNLTPGSKTTYIHLRPKSADGSVDDVDPQGNKTQKLCFWLNQPFVQRLLQERSGLKRPR
jgi:DNA mismatch repair protein MutH